MQPTRMLLRAGTLFTLSASSSGDRGSYRRGIAPYRQCRHAGEPFLHVWITPDRQLCFLGKEQRRRNGEIRKRHRCPDQAGVLGEVGIEHPGFAIESLGTLRHDGGVGWAQVKDGFNESLENQRLAAFLAPVSELPALPP